MQGTDTIWEAFFARCATEAKGAMDKNWISKSDRELLFAGLPALVLLQCLLEANSSAVADDIEKNDSVSADRASFRND